MIQIREIDHLVLRVTKLEAMLQFYCDVLGCRIERTQEELGLTQLRVGRSMIDMVTADGKLGIPGGRPPGVEGRNMDHLCLRVEPFNAQSIYEHLRQYGIEAGEVCSKVGFGSDFLEIKSAPQLVPCPSRLPTAGSLR